MTIGRNWDLTPDETGAAMGVLLISFARCLPRTRPRSEIEPMLENLLDRNPVLHQLSAPQRAFLWERYQFLLDAAYLEFEKNPDP